MTLEAFLRHLAFAGVLALISALCVRLMIARPILDHPDARKAHKHPTPKGGGVGIVVAFLVGMAVLFQVAAFARLADTQFVGVIAAAAAIALVALLDDIWDFRFIVKLAAQAGAALVAVAGGIALDRLSMPGLGMVSLGFAGVALTLFWIIACTNAVNFMDGLDGLVGGSLFLACAILALIAAQEGGLFVYACALILAAGLAGFLPFNLHPARIFMGDVGSQFLGFVMAVLAVASARFDLQQLSFLIVPLLLFGLLFDTGFTLLRRALMRERISAPHRSHLYQMAQRSGVSVRRVALVHWVFVCFHGALVALFLRLSPEAKPLVVLPAILVQLAWLGYVARRVRAAGLSWRSG
ncbi:glycosyltransferase family 4 protein [Plastoroseomonas arctica]|uniref:Undecaprenyl/decaprenyl-phosphate alpha-N-acetylglucosaminyl 1-phosphate transferase n=1 Tax=Plastoroseomonas arctica TaxID=1509237 RepID=A0AAF1JXR2_9PROT|nr:undecaprenyl/decaprenyl-phosphate alpha-N-acetylglucosaminyl 1-phosphate transferase [Plastoroseomonas arctica]MBR0656374.1 undecaprenyl/decaprenyl-phosphate alpha-N-acetylglucosaminyl 1-phosphate transferase [Plastoroseomonas arctica]